MKIERFEVAGLAQYAWIVSDGGEAVVIDPARDSAPYLAYAAQNRLRIVAVLDTHIHADFASGSPALAQAAAARLLVSAYDRGEHFSYAMPHEALHDGDTVRVGALRLAAMHTPGHTPEHLSFLLYEPACSETDAVAIFTGDFVFVGSLGRPDLLGEEAKAGLAKKLFASVQRLKSLPDGLEIFPGHGAGSLCGAGIGDGGETTLGFERRANPYFSYGEEEFVEKILASVPELPAYYPRMKALNSAGAPPFESLPPPRAMSVEEVTVAAASGATLLDLRRPEAFGGAHIAGAINIGSGGNLPMWAGWLIDPAKDIVLISDTGADEEARRMLARVGLDRVTGYLDGGMSTWIAAGENFARTTQLSATEVEQRAAASLVLDVRTNSEWSGGGIPGAKHIPLGELPRRMAELDPAQPIIAVCGSGYRSSIAASLLARSGFTNVSSLSGGMGAWSRRKRQ